MSELDDYLNEVEPETEIKISFDGSRQTVYKLDSKGKQRQWSIEVVGAFPDGVQTVGTCLPPMEASPVGRIIIETGLVYGKKVVQTIDITEGKNLGKANATTPYTQALAEALAKLEQQLRSGYVYNLEDVKESGTLGSGLPQCMLAQKHDPIGKQKGSKTLEKMKIKGEKIHVQPKLDGNRCLIVINPTSATMYTRKGDVMPVQLDHILSEVQESFKDATSTWSSIILDGELFSSQLSFNEINGHLKRKDNQDLEQLAKINYHIYDVMVDRNYIARYEIVKRYASNHVKVIPSYEIVATDANIKEKLEEFLAAGHEGLMIRTLDKGYENKRAWQLCKVKIFEDEEFEVVDLEEDSMGRLGFVILKLNEPSADRDGKVITTFKAGLTGIDHTTGKKMLQEKDKYVGKQATIEFFGKSEYAVPRFPKFKGVRDDA